jgi:hypothetical protein
VVTGLLLLGLALIPASAKSIQNTDNCLILNHGSRHLTACVALMRGKTQKIWGRATFTGQAYLIEVRTVRIWSSSDLIDYCDGAAGNVNPPCSGLGNAPPQLVPVPSGAITTKKYGADTPRWTKCWAHTQVTFRIRWTQQTNFTHWHRVNSDRDVMIGVIAGCWTP